ncbi:hypothetical protein CPY53_04275 [Paenibacillus polymyxa]|uniref:hypothetical protein n=1 Tax=Paenibacillus polymyxa TaxID=1406 RepID=UPI001F5AC50C|nr:hypothetical protein [Paenibacillus polymyxa]UNL92821.1 hypothetical protein CPY53_04275 [Paenibacillus polymyxa]
MRDLNADLALCETATEGPLYAVPHEWPGNDKLRFWVDNLADGIGCFVRREDAVFHVEAREGWPEAIRRAIASERENAELRDQLMTVFQKARNDVARWDGGQCVGLPVFQDRVYARRLVKDLQPILFPIRNK